MSSIHFTVYNNSTGEILRTGAAFDAATALLQALNVSESVYIGEQLDSDLVYIPGGIITARPEFIIDRTVIPVYPVDALTPNDLFYVTQVHGIPNPGFFDVYHTIMPGQETDFEISEGLGFYNDDEFTSGNPWYVWAREPGSFTLKLVPDFPYKTFEVIIEAQDSGTGSTGALPATASYLGLGRDLVTMKNYNNGIIDKEAELIRDAVLSTETPGVPYWVKLEEARRHLAAGGGTFHHLDAEIPITGANRTAVANAIIAAYDTWASTSGSLEAARLTAKASVNAATTVAAAAAPQGNWTPIIGAIDTAAVRAAAISAYAASQV